MLDAAAAVAAIVACLIILWMLAVPSKASSAAQPGSAREVRLPAEPIALSGAALKGQLGAPVVMVEFSDFQCPYCATFADGILPTIFDRYVSTGRLLMAFRHLPLPMHAEARKAAEIAACADGLGRFWEVHSAFFRRPTGVDFGKRASTAGVSDAEVDRCGKSGSAAIRVQADMDLARSLEIRATPTFLIGRNVGGAVEVTQILRGSRSLAAFQEAIDAVVNQSR